MKEDTIKNTPRKPENPQPRESGTGASPGGSLAASSGGSLAASSGGSLADKPPQSHKNGGALGQGHEQRVEPDNGPKMVLEPTTPVIVMVDDESTNLQIVRIILSRENLGANLHLFDNGPDALEFLQEHKVELILLDLAMPMMDGFQVLRELRETPGNQETPVIFLSAFQDTEYILKAFELGATDFLSKPIISPVLIARIHTLLQTQALKNQLQQSNQSLVSANRLKDELLSIVSHDLRSPLSAIELLCQFLQDSVDGQSEQSQEELIHRILNQSRLSRRLVENLLNLNRVEGGILTPNLAFFHMAELISNCAEDEGPIFEAGKIEFQLNLPDEEMVCYGDREMIAQVIRNVLGNAIKYAESTVSLNCKLINYTQSEGGGIEVTIRDDGEGVPPEQRAMIFEKYGKGDRRSGGSGLGLYISKRMVDLHGGEISMNSEPGSHAEFVIKLPNLFKPEHIPQLSEIYDCPVAVLSPYTAGAELLEGLMVEGGMVQVETRVVEQGVSMEPLSFTPKIIVLDAVSGRFNWQGYMQNLFRNDWMSDSEVHVVVYGDKGLCDAMQASQKKTCHQLPRPLNPLVFFKLLMNLVKEENTDKQARISV